MKLSGVNSISFAGAQTTPTMNSKPKKSYAGRVIGTIAGLGAGGALIIKGVPKANGKSWPGIIGGIIIGTAYAIGSYFDSQKTNQ